ncbi:TonB-dependent receptor [Gayadomonas joobiniege]|uniref:TonB-dependent receptor n=1 Tax=Gayadomonas joobiniege TaxID=1234606 RepID=UPI00037B10AE|nr:TonB-dependent receptor [Gayadomonas joobiniege]
MQIKSKIKPTLTALSVFAAINAANAQDADTNAQVEDTEVIEVTGLRNSVISATDLKKNANKLVDAINAEDVGKFPDSNVMDSLQRITGVQIIRDDAGDAASFQIRGMSQNRVELNGRSMAAGEGEGRNANLGDIPSELIAGLEVIKSPTADMTEGSLGATVNLKTARPFNFAKPLVKLNLKAKYGNNIDEVYGNYNVVLSDTWENEEIGKFGVLVNATYNDNRVSGDTLRLNGWGNRCTTYAVSKPDGTLYRTQNGVTETENNCATFTNNGHSQDVQMVYAPNASVHLQSLSERERSSLNTTFQWKPTSNSEYIFDFNYLYKDDRTFNQTYRLGFNQGRDFMDPAIFDGKEDGYLHYAYQDVELAAPVEITNQLGEVAQTVQPVEYVNMDNAFTNGGGSQGMGLTTERYVFGLSGEWNFDNFQLSSEASYSTSEFERHYISIGMARWAGNDTTMNDQTLRVDPDEAIRLAGQSLTMDLRGDTVGIDWQGADLLDPRIYRLSGLQDDGWIHKPSVAEFKADVDYDLFWHDFTTLEFGVRLTENVMERTSRFRFTCNRNYAYGADGPNGNSYDADTDRECTDPSVSVVDLMAAHPEAFDVVEGYFSDADKTNFTSWLGTNNRLYFDDKEKWRDIFGFYDEGEDVVNSGYVYDPIETYKLTEETAAIYLKANLDGEIFGDLIYRGNFGVRGVYTSIESLTYPNATLENKGSPLTLEHDYFEALPSVNLALVYDESTIARFAAAKVMVRPNFGELKPTGSFNQFIGCNVYNPADPFNSLGLAYPDPNASEEVQAQQLALQEAIANDYGTGLACPGIRGFGTTIGNIELAPYTAYNYDLSLEKYWGKGNSASATLFYRDVQADIVRSNRVFRLPVETSIQLPEAVEEGYELWRVKQMQNGGESVRQGFELAFTQFFDFLPGIYSGLGVQLNYTYADGSRPDALYIDQNDNFVSADTEGAQLYDQEAFKPVIDLSKHSYNASLFYDKHGVNVRVSYNFRDAYYKGNNLYNDDTERLDFASSYQVTKSVRATFNIQNLLGTWNHQYDYDPSITRRLSYSDTTYTLGVGVRF